MTKIATARQKGKDLENFVSDQLIAYCLDDRSNRDGGSGAGNREKRDVQTAVQISGRTIGIECKNQKTPHIREWWKQTQQLEVLGYEPVLIYKLFGEGMGEVKTVIYLSTFLELLKNQSGIKIEAGIPQKDKWLVKNGIENLKQIIKVLEKYGDTKTE